MKYLKIKGNGKTVSFQASIYRLLGQGILTSLFKFHICLAKLWSFGWELLTCGSNKLQSLPPEVAMAVSHQEPDLELSRCSQHTRNSSKTPSSCSLTLSSPFQALCSPCWNLPYTSLFEILLYGGEVLLKSNNCHESHKFCAGNTHIISGFCLCNSFHYVFLMIK